jgi:hypothetical protein
LVYAVYGGDVLREKSRGAWPNRMKKGRSQRGKRKSFENKSEKSREFEGRALNTGKEKVKKRRKK